MSKSLFCFAFCFLFFACTFAFGQNQWRALIPHEKNKSLEVLQSPPEGVASISWVEISPTHYVVTMTLSEEYGGDWVVFDATPENIEIIATSTEDVEAFGEFWVPVPDPTGIRAHNSPPYKDPAFGFIPQQVIYIKDSSGVVYTPETKDEFVNACGVINGNGQTIRTLIIKGHGCSEVIELGTDGILIVPGGSVLVADNDGNDSVDITNVLQNITDDDSVIRLRGCFTVELADDLEDVLEDDGDSPDCKGAIRFVLGVPGTPWGAGVYR